MITTQAELRKRFWEENPNLDRKRIKSYDGKGKMYKTDTRVAWGDFLDHMQANGEISEDLADRALLNPKD